MGNSYVNIHNTGWVKQIPDVRDYTIKSLQIKTELRPIIKGFLYVKNPPKIDLRTNCSPIEDQLNLGSCCSHACVGVMEYYQLKHKKNYIDLSRLMLYKKLRDLEGHIGDTGGTLRGTIKAAARWGVAPEKNWPYDVSRFDIEIPNNILELASKYKPYKYFSHDAGSLKLSKKKILESVKKFIAVGVPSVCGFYGSASYDQGDIPGGIPFPDKSETIEWGHAIALVGYDDNIIITNMTNNKKTKGAFLFRNSWGEGWGVSGYGWIPYDFILFGLMEDFWSLLSVDLPDLNGI